MHLRAQFCWQKRPLYSLPQRWPHSGRTQAKNHLGRHFLLHFASSLPVKPSGCLGRELLSRRRRKDCLGFQGFEHLLACAPDLNPQNPRYEPGPFSSCSGGRTLPTQDHPQEGAFARQALDAGQSACPTRLHLPLPASETPLILPFPWLCCPLPGAAPCIGHCGALLP